MDVMVNGERLTLPDGMSVSGLLASRGMKDTRVAVELNRAILPRESYDGTTLSEGDNVEVLGFVGGG